MCSIEIVNYSVYYQKLVIMCSIENMCFFLHYKRYVLVFLNVRLLRKFIIIFFQLFCLWKNSIVVLLVSFSFLYFKASYPDTYWYGCYCIFKQWELSIFLFFEQKCLYVLIKWKLLISIFSPENGARCWKIYQWSYSAANGVPAAAYIIFKVGCTSCGTALFIAVNGFIRQ